MRPVEKLIKCYKAWKQGGEQVEKNDLIKDDGVSADWDEFTYKQNNLIARCAFLFLTQGIITFMVGNEIISSDPEVWYTYPASQTVVLARFMCSVVLHVSLNGDLSQGLTNMKYAINHDWKFVHYHIAWLCGFMQAFNVIVVELVAFMALLTYSSVDDVIKNFLALVVISHFGQYFFGAVRQDPLVQLITGSDHY